MYNILIVDDEPLIRQGLRKFLDWKKHGFEIVDEADNAHTALEKFGKSGFDVVLTDIRIPPFDGLELIGKIRSQCEIEPIFIVLSGYSEFKYAKKAIELEVADYLVKPLQEDEIVTVLKRVKLKLDERRKDSPAGRAVAKLLGDSPSGHNDSSKLLREIIYYLESNIGSEIGLELLGSKFGLNPNYISQLFKKQINMNFIDLFTALRMEKAKELLDDVTLKAYEVSSRVGYEDSRYFSQAFKKFTGMTPTEYRDRRS